MDITMRSFWYVMSVSYSYSVCYGCLIDVLRTSRKQTIDVDIDMFPFDNPFPDVTSQSSLL